MSSRLGRLRDARLIALSVIVIAVILYLAPYVVGATECIGKPKPKVTVRECMTDIYHDARSDTNLAAGVIALAVILAAWRPIPEGTE